MKIKNPTQYYNSVIQEGSKIYMMLNLDWTVASSHYWWLNSRGCSAVQCAMYLPQKWVVISHGCMGIPEGFTYINIQKANYVI